MYSRDKRSSSRNQTAIDDALLALSDARRRCVVYFLLDRNSSSVEEVVDVVAESRHVPRGRGGARARVRIALLHKHLPKLRDAGIVLYDAAGEQVSLPELSDPVRALVEWCYEREVSR